jgi:Domain of unknown function (DUF6362)
MTSEEMLRKAADILPSGSSTAASSIGRRPGMNIWTVEMVEARLVEAASVMRRLPPSRVPGYFNTWPSMVVEFADHVGQQPQPMRPPPPSPAAISRMEEILLWLRWLEVDDAKLVWARADRTQWKAICWQFSISRATANRRWHYALSVIAWRLSGRSVPRKRSRRFVVAMAEGH